MFSRPQHNLDLLDIQLGMSVLECGVGAGDYTHEICKRVGSEGIVYGADIQKNILQKAQADTQQYHPNPFRALWTDFDVQGSLKNIPDMSVDRILIANVLFQLTHPQYLLDECKRVLKSDGRMLLVDWRDSFQHIGPHPQSIVHPDTARQYFEKAGFRIHPDMPDVGPHHYGYIIHQ